ncbi:P-loop containing nucleoside triphosphate hydrolase protein [Aspergillus stella-maris]|uniref:P-loop containing nucleoside triphosphate hydrolase protein n=1 Tax=Aspergillus stella-maris TaxID=1810926 RepID=UPI003CCCCE8B
MPQPTDWRQKATIIYILGPPGTGKATQSTLLSTRHTSVAHIPLHALLETSFANQSQNRSESKYHANIEKSVREGKTSSKAFCVDLLRYALVQGVYKEGKKVFIIEGFPLMLDEAELFEAKICKPALVLNLTCPESDSVPRLVSRGVKEGMRYDSTASILDRLKKFERDMKPVVEFYRERGIVRDIDASKGAEEVYWEVRAVLAEEGVVIFKT